MRAQAVRKGSRLQEGAGQSAARARDGREAGGKARRCGGGRSQGGRGTCGRGEEGAPGEGGGGPGAGPVFWENVGKIMGWRTTAKAWWYKQYYYVSRKLF